MQKIGVSYLIVAASAAIFFGSCKMPNRQLGDSALQEDDPGMCSGVSTIREFVGCLNSLPKTAQISDVIAVLPASQIRCTTSKKSAQPGSPTNPRCFMMIEKQPGFHLIPSWTLDGNRIELGEEQPGIKVEGRTGIIMGDIDFDLPRPLDVKVVFDHAINPPENHDPCSHCHRLFRKTADDKMILGEYFEDDVVQPGVQVFDSVEGMPIHRPISINGDEVESIKDAEIPQSKLLGSLTQLSKVCIPNQLSERCKRLDQMIKLVASFNQFNQP